MTEEPTVLFDGLQNWDVGKNCRTDSPIPYAVHLEFDDVEVIRRWVLMLLELPAIKSEPTDICKQCGAALDGHIPPLCEDCAEREALTPPERGQ